MTHDRTFLRRSLALLGFGVAVLIAPAALCREEFPGDAAKYLKMPCVPQCTICHRTDAGGLATLKPITIDGQQKLGLGMNLEQKFSLDWTVESSIYKALDADAAFNGGKGYDTDGDGVSDVDELKAGTDPNDPSAGASLCGPVYGCVRVAPGGHVDNVATASAAVVAVIGIGLLRRRRQPTR